MLLCNAVMLLLLLRQATRRRTRRYGQLLEKAWSATKT